ncbi:MAG: hypothetical protein KBF73_00810 [Flavobacteriales bacterium]|nr:hypothetical protein [Flavobacteriales bacterium]
MRLLTFILVLLAELSFGQAPGYMDRKLLITSEVSFFNALFNPNHNFNEGIRKFSFNLRSTTDIDYVVARNGTIGVTFDVFSTSMKYHWNSDQYDQLLIPNIDRQFEHSRITGYGYGINYKVFRNPSRGGIAPIGSYIKFDVMLLDVHLRPYNLTTETAHSYSDRFFTPAFSFTLGQQRIFWDFLILRTGVQLGFVPMGISPYLQDMGDGIVRGTQQQELRAYAESRILTYYLLNINFGVGFLLPFRKNYKNNLH